MGISSSPALPSVPPLVGPDSRRFWEGTRRGVLLGTSCGPCRRWSWPPVRAFCPHCGSDDVNLDEMSGRGTVYSYTLVHRGSGPYHGVEPFYIAYVLLEEQVMMLTNLIGFNETIPVSIGAAVQVTFDPAGTDADLPRFSPASIAADVSQQGDQVGR